MDFIMNFFTDFANDFYLNFIKEDRWKYIVDGLGVTLQVTLFAVLIGIALGFIVAVIRSTHDKTGKMKFLNWICNKSYPMYTRTPE